jgi:Protein of unknown function
VCLLSICTGIMFPDLSFNYGPPMPPDRVDQAILTCCKTQFSKVAMVLHRVAVALDLREDPKLDVVVAERIKALVKAGKLDGAGNLDRWTYSEVRLPPKRT